MKKEIDRSSFDAIVEQNYPLIYRCAAELVTDPRRAVSLANRVFFRARDLFEHGLAASRARAVLLKILYLESLSESLREPAISD